MYLLTALLRYCILAAVEMEWSEETVVVSQWMRSLISSKFVYLLTCGAAALGQRQSHHNSVP